MTTRFVTQKDRKTARGPKPLNDEQSLYEYAVGALGRRMRTVAQLRNLLRRRVTEESGPALIEAVITRLKARNYLSDSQYAAVYSAQRKEGRRLGSRRVAQDLRAKGVHPDVIAEAVKTAYQGSDEESQARAFLARKRMKKPEDQRQSAKVLRTLTRAGYSVSIAIRILRSWDVDVSADEMTE